ncbi:MAG: type II CAAX endopeptidase family protein [Tissierellia bacterium]|nr:type II CAAX endopeptidase family protein [Tissierellia bacterium]
MERKQEKLFYIFNFGLTIFMSIPLFFAYIHKKDTTIFPLAQMLYPAFGVMMARVLTKGSPKKIFYPYLFGTILVILGTLSIFFTDSISLNLFSQGVIIVLSLYIIFQVRMLYKIDSKELYRSGLHLGHIKKGIPWVLFFASMIFLRFVFGHLLIGTMDEFIDILKSPRTLFLILLLPINFILSWIPFFGEEYGWRYFLQPILQKKFGMKKGILLLGCIWGIWHLPLNLMFYNSPDQGLLSVLTQFITCIGYGIFFGFLYQKTDSIWIVSFLHYMNNNLAVLLSGKGPEALQNNVYTWGEVGLHGLITFVFFGGFLLAKEFQGRNTLPTMEERLEYRRAP